MSGNFNYVAKTSLEVVERLDKVSNLAGNFYESKEFSKRLTQLKHLKAILIRQEKQMYELFGVKNIGELNDRVNKYQALRFFESSKLTNILNSKGLYDEYKIPTEELLDRILGIQLEDNQTIENAINCAQKQDRLMEEIVDNIIPQLNKKLEDKSNGKSRIYHFNKSLNSNSLQGITRLLCEYTNNSLKQNPEKINASKKLRSKMMLVLDEAEINNKGEIVYKISESNREVYAGWHVLWKDIQDDPARQTDIYLKIYELCCDILKNKGATSIELSAFTKAYNDVSVQSLLASTVANVVGVLGEVQGIAYLYLLSNYSPKMETLIHTGPLKNELQKSREPAIDILLDGVGFQVKNYNEFASEIPGTIAISKENNLTFWEKKLNLNQTLRKMLDLFYSTKSFNVQVDSDFSPIRERIEIINDDVMANFFSLYQDAILILSQKIKVDELIAKDKYYNVFYYKPGSGYIPSSDIIENIISFFSDEQYLNNLYLPEVSSSYNGPTYKTYYNKKNYDIQGNDLSIQSVVNQVSLDIKTRINLKKYFDKY